MDGIRMLVRRTFMKVQKVYGNWKCCKKSSICVSNQIQSDVIFLHNLSTKCLRSFQGKIQNDGRASLD